MQHWVHGTLANNGLLVREPTENVDNILQFYSTNPGTSSSVWPYLKVTYEPFIGETPWWTYTTTPLDRWMHLHVNVANGNLVVHTNLGPNIPGVNGLNEVIQPHYNNLSSDVMDMGIGRDIGLLIFSDGSAAFYGPTGYQIPFIKQPNGTFTPPSGINAQLVKNSDGTYTMTMDATGQQYHFASSGYLTSITNRQGNAITFTYNPSGLLTQITNTEGQATTLGYNSSDEVATITDPSGNVWHYAYDSQGNLTSVTDPLGNVTQFGYDSQDNLTQITDPNGNETQISYNSSDQVTQIVRVTNTSQGTGPTWQFSYGTTSTQVTGPNGHTTTYGFDPHGRVTQITAPDGQVTKTSWTADSQVSQQTQPSGATTTYQYNSLNDLTQVAEPTGATHSYQYGDSSQPYQYTAVTNPEGGTTTYRYNSRGLLTSVKDAAGHTTSYTYNSNGTLASLTDPNGHTTNYGYTSQGLLASISYPSPLGAVHYTYTADDQVASMTDGQGQTTDYTYNADNELTQISYANGSSIRYTYDKAGNLTGMADSTGTTTYQYNALNQEVEKTLPSSASTTYAWDGEGHLTSVQNAGGTVSYTYTADGQVASVQDPSGTITMSYDSNGNRTAIAFPNGVTESMTYNGSGQLTAIKATNSSGAVLDEYTYSYTNPNTGAATDLRYQVTNAAGDVTQYQYDALNRLTEATETSPSGTTLASDGYTYDAAGNLLSEDRNGTTTDMTYNAANELTQAGSTTYSYDANGNLTGNSAGLSMSYNAANQTTSIAPPGGSAQTEAYSGPTQVQQIQSGSTGFGYNRTGLSQYTSSAGTTYVTRTPGGQLLDARTPSGTYDYLVDGLGSVIALVNSSGTVVNRYHYDPYGNIVSETQQVANPFRWIGAVWDSTTHLYKIGARWYDPQVGRWTQMDPVFAGTLTNPQTLNRYAYAGDSPAVLLDPSGLSWLGTVSSVITIGCGVWGYYGALTLWWTGYADLVTAFCAAWGFATALFP